MQSAATCVIATLKMNPRLVGAVSINYKNQKRFYKNFLHCTL